MKKIKDFFSPSSDGSTSSHPKRSKSLGPPSSHRYREPPLRPPRTIEKSYYVNEKGYAPSYYPSAENENDDEKERGRSGSASSKEDDRDPGILFKIGRIALLSSNRSSGKKEGKASGSGTGSRKSGESSRKHDSNPHLELHSLERTKSSKLRKRQPRSPRMDSIKRRMSGSGTSKSVPRSNPHFPRSPALRNPATRARGNEAPPVPSMPPEWTQKVRMAEEEASMLPETETESEVSVVEDEGRKRMPFISVEPESGRKPFVTVGVGVNQLLQVPGDNLKMQGGASNRREEAAQIVSRKQTEQQQVWDRSPWWRGTAEMIRKKLKIGQAKGKEEVQKANKKAVAAARTKEKQSKVKEETAGVESKEERLPRLKREEAQQEEEFNQAQERRKQEEFELRKAAEKAQRKVDRAKVAEAAKQREKGPTDHKAAEVASAAKKQKDEEGNKLAVQQAKDKTEKIVAREKAQKGRTERERQEASEKQQRSQARQEQATRERQEAEEFQRQQEEAAAELARKEAKRATIRRQNESRRLQALARATSKKPAVMVTPATLPEASAARLSAQVSQTANTKNLQAPGPAPLTQPNPQALATKFGDPEDGDIGDMARTHVQGMLGKTVIEANTQMEQQSLNLKRTVIATLAPANLFANIGDMQRSYVEGMIEVKEANKRARWVAGKKT